jgi:diguanylate cyclase (GGDEF)-like protein
LFSSAIVDVLGNPFLLIIPKILNIAAGCLVLGLLLGRWLPTAMRERRKSDQTAATLRHQATVDGMTGLYNRSYFNSLAESEWDRFRRHRRPLSLLMLDIDQFKSINDRYGHDVGDRVIVEIANACRAQKRKSDVAARLGGEEFAMLLPETQLEAARVVAERLRETISKYVVSTAEGNVSVTVSIGVSEASGTRNVLDLLKRADLALYRAKREGRNRVFLFDETSDDEGQLECADGLVGADR